MVYIDNLISFVTDSSEQQKVSLEILLLHLHQLAKLLVFESAELWEDLNSQRHVPIEVAGRW